MKIIFAIGLALMSASCFHSAPSIDPPRHVDTPEKWAAPAASGAVEGRWWQEFGVSELDRLIVEALRENPDLHAAQARLQAAAMQAEIAGALLLPLIEGRAAGARQRQNFIGFPIPGAEERRVLSTTFTTYGVSINAQWEADLWGRLSDGEAAAVADLQSVDADLQGARQSLAAQVSKAWFAAAEARRQVAFTRSTLESFQRTSEIVRFRYEEGLASALDLRLARSSVASAEAILKDRERLFDHTVRQLEILLGRYPEAVLLVTPELPQLPAPPPAGVPAELVSRRPDVAAAERRLAASVSRARAARKDLYPRFSLTSLGGTSSQRLRDVLNPDFAVWNLIGNAVRPIFDGGRLRAQVKADEAVEAERLAVFASVVLNAFREVETALAAEELLQERERALGEATTHASASLRLSEERYRFGLEGIVSVLEAQRRALESESQLLAVRRFRLENRIDLHLALGGGFEAERSFPTEGQP
ncbi:MAG TPA: TolC family protein [Acidobacteriota bacterium]|nr:TolC family protein [Acidobacteriota bacterium]